MRLFNKTLIILGALAWIALLAGALLLVWQPERSIDWTTASWTFTLDFMLEGEAEKVLASIVFIALMLPALALIVAELAFRDRRPAVATAAPSAAREAALERQLEEERERARPRPEPATARGETPQRWRFLPGRR